MEQVKTLIIGGGQAGLVMSDMLRRRGQPHLILERGRIAERWRSERWDGLRFQFPNWAVRLPDWPFPHSDPDGFAAVTEIVAYLEAYARKIAAPLRCGVAVTALRRTEDGKGFIAETSAGAIAAAQVVVATGPYQRPALPDLPLATCDLFQLHASAYRAPAQLPPGAVLIVGSGASGAQIAEELARAGRPVYLSVGRHKRMPRRYRGRDFIWWLSAMGLDQTPVAARGPDATLPLITGAYGGHTLDLRDFAAQGMVLLGRLRAIEGRTLRFAADLRASIAAGDAAYRAFLERADNHVAAHGLSLPADPEAWAIGPDPPEFAKAPLELDAGALGAIVWATGYELDFRWIELPVLDERGAPRHDRGVASVPGLYFLGLAWLSKMSSSFLSGVADDAARLADCIKRAA